MGTNDEIADEPSYEIESFYANNSILEASVWDLKIIFGQLEQHTGEPKVDWHTSITMPWAQAKIVTYFLRLNVLQHSIQFDPLKTPALIVPPKPKRPSGPTKDNEEANRFYEAATAIHEEMFGE